MLIFMYQGEPTAHKLSKTACGAITGTAMQAKWMTCGIHSEQTGEGTCPFSSSAQTRHSLHTNVKLACMCERLSASKQTAKCRGTYDS
jgi:hypothetical protein